MDDCMMAAGHISAESIPSSRIEPNIIPVLKDGEKKAVRRRARKYENKVEYIIPPAPRIVDNMSIILGCRDDRALASVWNVSLSTISNWRKLQRVPLHYVYTFLSIVSYEELAYGYMKGTVYEKRGYTRDINKAAESENSPLFILARIDFVPLMKRIRKLAGKKSAAEVSRATENTSGTVYQWKARAKVSDRACFALSAKYKVTIDWLLTGRDISEENSEENALAQELH